MPKIPDALLTENPLPLLPQGHALALGQRKARAGRAEPSRAPGHSRQFREIVTPGPGTTHSRLQKPPNRNQTRNVSADTLDLEHDVGWLRLGG
jgi:hypothetical protein